MVQYYYYNKMQLSGNSTKLVDLLLAEAQKAREAEAEKLALARAQRAKAIHEKMANTQLRAQIDKRNRALAAELIQRAAADTIQRAIRRCMGVMTAKKLRRRRAAFIRHFVGDQVRRPLHAVTCRYLPF